MGYIACKRHSRRTRPEVIVRSDLLQQPGIFQGMRVVRVDTPTDTTIVGKAHDPCERLRDGDAARNTLSRLLDDEHDHVAEVTRLLDLDVRRPPSAWANPSRKSRSSSRVV